jgi:hypothetical protein
MPQLSPNIRSSSAIPKTIIFSFSRLYKQQMLKLLMFVNKTSFQPIYVKKRGFGIFFSVIVRVNSE